MTRKRILSEAAAAMGRIGGKSTSKAKRMATRRNIAVARAAREVVSSAERAEILALHLSGVPRREILAKFNRWKPGTIAAIMYRKSKSK